MDYKEMTDGELDEHRVAILTEIERRQRAETAQQRAEDAARDYADAISDEAAHQWESGMVVGPGEKVIEDGIEWVNTSLAWLSVPPSAYPLGYQRTTISTDVAPFRAGEQVQPRDLREYDGIVYQALQAHTTADHWKPGSTPSLWTEA